MMMIAKQEAGSGEEHTRRLMRSLDGDDDHEYDDGDEDDDEDNDGDDGDDDDVDDDGVEHEGDGRIRLTCQQGGDTCILAAPAKTGELHFTPLQSGAMLHWCTDSLVHWCNGALVWCSPAQLCSRLHLKKIALS